MSDHHHVPRRPGQSPLTLPPNNSNVVRMDYQSMSDTSPTTTLPPTTFLDDGPHQSHRNAHTSSSASTNNNNTNSNNNNDNNNTTSSSSMQYKYRGFGTSINDMFTEIHNERIDCCSITLCGILQNDRDRYLMNQISPPSIFKRFLVHFMIPFCIFCAAGLGAMQISDVVLNEIVSVILIVLFIGYLLLQCSKGRYKRIDVRKDILFTKYQIQQQNLLSNIDDDNNTPQQDHLQQHPQQQHRHMVNHRRNSTHVSAVLLEQQRPRRDTSNEPIYYLGQTLNDMSCAHPCCMVGCYAVDYHHSMKQNNSNIDENLCRCLYDYVCPAFCGSYIQCCGMCAIAQEARDIETYILPPPYRRIDYIS